MTRLAWDRRALAIVSAVLCLAALVLIARGGMALARQERARQDSVRLGERLEALRSAPASPKEITVARAPFATWAHFVASLHEALAASELDDVAYETGSVVPVANPEGPRLDPPAPPDEPTDYHAMTAHIRGRGTYEEIVDLIGRLADASPPLALERLEITAAERRPQFEAVVSLLTALPVAEPRVVALPTADPAGGAP